MGGDSDFIRKNGLQWPPHKLQVATWVLFPLLVTHYYGFLRPLIYLPDSLGIAITALFTVSCVLAVVYGYITCAVDPADDSLLCEDGSYKTNSNASNTDSNSKPGETSIYCYLCESNVDKSAKHCRYCQKCVTRFDHHCKWLNTCVGAKNYKYFLVSIFSVTCFTSISLGLSMGYMIEAFGFTDQIMDRLEDAGEHHAISVNLLKGVAMLSAIVLLPLVGLVYQLVGFHIMLIYKNITTYEFIVLEQKRLRDAMDAQRNAKAAARKQAAAASAKEKATGENASSSSSLSASVPVLEGGGGNDLAKSSTVGGSQHNKKNDEGALTTTNSPKVKDGFEMVPLDETDNGGV